jgi:hypothetical protein
LRVLVDGDFTVERPPRGLVCPDDLSAEVREAGDAVHGFAGGELLDVDAGQSTGLREPQEFVEDESVVVEELLAAAAVPEIPQAWAVGEQGREGR